MLTSPSYRPPAAMEPTPTVDSSGSSVEGEVDFDLVGLEDLGGLEVDVEAELGVVEEGAGPEGRGRGREGRRLRLWLRR